MKTYSAKPNPDARNWVVVDLAGQRVGRAASQVAALLRGKHRPDFTPHVDTGDFVIAVNADKVVLTGNKLRDKRYFRHSGFPGGIKDLSAEQLLERAPEELFAIAVKGMLPKNKLGRSLIAKLKVYAGEEHPHQAQQPEPYDL